MPLNADDKSLIKTLVKFTVIGMAVSLIALFVIDKDFKLGDTVVEFKEISSTESEQLSRRKTTSSGHATTYSDAVKSAAPAVVNIFTAKTVSEEDSPFAGDPLFERFFGENLPFGPEERRETSLGSGVIISSQGYILTNNHVVEQADEIDVALKDGRTARAEVVGTDPESDLAVLKVELNQLPVITMGHSEHLGVGDVVLAIGNPFGVGQTVTMGIVSAIGRDRLGLHTFENFIQTDAAINPGNSGGALVNAFGHLVGINTAIFSRSGGSQGIGFAIPIVNAKEVTEQIIKFGHVVRGWLGVEIQDMTPQLAESFGLKETKGVIVAGVLRNGPADKAGLKPGDIIVEVEGEKITDGKQTVKLIARASPGTEINLTILRGGDKSVISATTSERPIPSGQR